MGLLAVGLLLGNGARSEAWNLSELPSYQPVSMQPGTLRIYGSGLDGLVRMWEAAFRRYHPQTNIEDSLPTSDAALPALITGVADLAPDGGEATLTETLAFYETYGYHPTDITVASGAYDVEGHSNGPVVYVNQNNPLTGLTLDQLDGIFGAERTAGLHGFQWSLAAGRGSERDIRRWGQLGLSGDWKRRPIQTYGHAPSGTARFFQLRVLGNGDKWNPNYREYVESGSKMIADDDRGAQRAGLKRMLTDELARNRYGIAWTVQPQAKSTAGVRPLALAARIGGPFVMPSNQSFQDRSYPLVRNIYIFLNRPPGKPLSGEQREFLRFVLSREGQEIVSSHGGYLPLTAQIVSEQLRRLEPSTMQTNVDH